MSKQHSSHGNGHFVIDDLASCGTDCIFESGVMVFHPENIHLGNGIYIGHQTILKGYYKNQMCIGDHSWIGQQCFLHSAGGISIGKHVGIGPGVRIISSQHLDKGRDTPLLFSEISFAPVRIGDDADLGIGACILPGVSIGKGALIGAGAVVSRDIPDYAVAAGVPAKVIRMRD